MTRKLYYEDVMQMHFNAKVISCLQDGESWRVILDQTAFYPEGGGQPADRGILGGKKVLDVQEENGEVVHWLDGAVSGCVSGEVDEHFRFDMMQQHTGEHILSGLICRTFGYSNVGFHIGSELVTVDFSGPITEEELLMLEKKANEIVWRNVPVQEIILKEGEKDTMSYRSKKEIRGDVRIIQIEDADTCACCGTHVLMTGAVGQIKAVSLQKYKQGVRIEMLSGERALDYENRMLAQIRKIGRQLSVQQEDTADAVLHLEKECMALRGEKNRLGMHLFEKEVEHFDDTEGARVVHSEQIALTQAGKAASILAQKAKVGMVLVGKDREWQFAAVSRQTDLRTFARELCKAFEGRGGGKPDIVQGSLKAGTFEEVNSWVSSFFG